jgi:hypothetical protein
MVMGPTSSWLATVASKNNYQINLGSSLKNYGCSCHVSASEISITLLVPLAVDIICHYQYRLVALAEMAWQAS